MSLGTPQSNIYIGTNALLLLHGGTKQQMGCNWVYWPQRSRNDFSTVGKSGSNLYASSYNRVRETKLWGAVCKDWARDFILATCRWLHRFLRVANTAFWWNLKLEPRAKPKPEQESEFMKQPKIEWEYYCLWWRLLVDLLQAHIHRLEESYSENYGECVARPFDQKVRTFSSERARWPVRFEAFRIVID